MKNIRKYLSILLALMVLLSCLPAAFAADAEDAVIHTDSACSLTIFKYDFTNAKKDGIWTEDSFVSTGWRESYVENVLGNAVRKGDANNASDNSLGNGQNSNGYAIAGVEFTYLRAADIVTFTESANDQHPDYDLVMVLYGFPKSTSAGLLSAIGLKDGAGSYENAAATDKLDSGCWYYTSDTLNKALSSALASNSTVVKDQLEAYIKNAGGTAMTLTDQSGKTAAAELTVGLYLLVETRVPEMVTSTVNPFFVSLPMTTVSGNDSSASPEGGHQWNYDVVVYPKNETGIPTLEKTVREAKTDTGKNNGTSSVTDGYAHTATGSAGDVMEYQFISTLPTITSQATALGVYNFYDSISEGLSYKKDAGVKIEFFTDTACTKKVTEWDSSTGKFTVTYTDNNRHMTIDMTQDGLDEINGTNVNVNGTVYAGYSNYTMRITYAAVIDSDSSLVCGAEGNDNEVVLTWKRTSSEYYDTLVDDAHVYSFGIDLTKAFSDKDSTTAESEGLYAHVKFLIWNRTDGYWLTAALNQTEGVYYVIGHTEKEASATVFTPVTSDGKAGRIIIKGCEDDTYVITEIETADGYSLLKDSITVTITASEASADCGIYAEDTLGVLQNDPHYSFNGGLDLTLANIPQKALAHKTLTASASVDGNAVNMVTDNSSANAEVSLKVVNTPGFDLPQTGDTGTWMFTVIGLSVMACSALLLFVLTRTRAKRG